MAASFAPSSSGAEVLSVPYGFSHGEMGVVGVVVFGLLRCARVNDLGIGVASGTVHPDSMP